MAWALFDLKSGHLRRARACTALSPPDFPRALADAASHAKSPGYFTWIAGTCVLGNQCVLLGDLPLAGLVFWMLGLALWCLLTYSILPLLMSAEKKPPFKDAISGTWLLAVVGMQAISVLGSLIAPSLLEDRSALVLFTSLAFWLAGSMLYIWLISLISSIAWCFCRFRPTELTPPYWIAMCNGYLFSCQSVVIRFAQCSPLLVELLPFLKGMTLLFWSTATWWIPLLLALGVWRHVGAAFRSTDDYRYWAAVFPWGCTPFVLATERAACGGPCVPSGIVFAILADRVVATFIGEPAVVL